MIKKGGNSMRKLGVKIYTNSAVKNRYIASEIMSFADVMPDAEEAKCAGFGHVVDFHIKYRDLCEALQGRNTANVEAIDEVIKCFIEDCECRYDIDCGDSINADDPDLHGEQFLRIYQSLMKIHSDLF